MAAPHGCCGLSPWDWVVVPWDSVYPPEGAALLPPLSALQTGPVCGGGQELGPYDAIPLCLLAV